jgi:hypothetical protein
MKNEFILFVRCEQPYPVDCLYRKITSYILRRKNESTEVKDFYSCGYIVSGPNIFTKCQYQKLFNPLIKESEVPDGK